MALVLSLIFSSCRLAPCRMSILTNGHVALSNSWVKSLMDGSKNFQSLKGGGGRGGDGYRISEMGGGGGGARKVFSLFFFLVWQESSMIYKWY